MEFIFACVVALLGFMPSVIVPPIPASAPSLTVIALLKVFVPVKLLSPAAVTSPPPPPPPAATASSTYFLLAASVSAVGAAIFFTAIPLLLFCANVLFPNLMETFSNIPCIEYTDWLLM